MIKDMVRGSNFQPTIWHYNYIQSLSTQYAAQELYAKRHEMLKGEVRLMLELVANPLEQLELTNMLQRLGLSYHFQDETKRILEIVYINNVNAKNKQKEKNLQDSMLEFRLLRQHGYNVSTESFSSLKDDMGSFKSSIIGDIEGMFSLYEASYLLIEGENILDEARNFTTKNLSEFVNKHKNDERSLIVGHALNLPLHWRMERVEARWFIDVYERMGNMNPVVLELAKLDFNMVQTTHQDDLKHASWWWKVIGLGEKLSFSRNTFMEDFFGILGMTFEPHLGYCRRVCSKVIQLVNVIDDICDVYGTFKELELFTDAIDRWDTNTIESLPEYMKMFFLALDDIVNQMAFDTLRKQGFQIVGHLKKVWVDLCKSYLIEAKWYYSGYTPTLQEYIHNGSISAAAPLGIALIYFCVANPITEEALSCLEEYPNIIHYSSIICRLANDLRPSLSDSGDVSKSVECYMNETKASKEDACEHVRSLIHKTWKMNEELLGASSSTSQAFIEIAMNNARNLICMYQEGDNYITEYPQVKDWISSLLVHPIALNAEE